MKIQYVSDIHLELLTFNERCIYLDTIERTCDILVLAGDIGNPIKNHYKHFLRKVGELFEKVFVIAGNHEYYGNTIEETNQKIMDVVAEFSNITFLNNNYEDYGGVRWIGTTLWTEIIDTPLFRMNDFRVIKDFDIVKYNQLHYTCKTFLESSLQNASEENIKTIVITHHLPFYELTNTYYRKPCYSHISMLFNANINDIIDKYKTQLVGWFYGHTHKHSIQTHYDINFYCNPIGYFDEINREELIRLNKNCIVNI
jgi:predicted phosphodiesterase